MTEAEDLLHRLWSAGSTMKLAHEAHQAILQRDAHISAQRRELEEAHADVHALTKALTGVTRMGSEFFIRKGERYVADIPACLEDVRRTRTSLHNVARDAILGRKDAEARAARAEALLGRMVEQVRPFAEFSPPAYVPDNHPMTAGSPMAKRQVTAADFRSLRALLEEIEEGRASVADSADAPRLTPAAGASPCQSEGGAS